MHDSLGKFDMRKGGGKQKGASFERLVCKQLSLWISEDKHEDLLWRSAMSGGRSTLAYKKGKRQANQAGDISSIHPFGNKLTDLFTVECKSYKDLHFIGLLTGKGALISFWQQACDQAAKHGKMPMLIAKQNQYPAIICLSDEAALLFNLKIEIAVESRSLYISLFDSFLKSAPVPRGRHKGK